MTRVPIVLLSVVLVTYALAAPASARRVDDLMMDMQVTPLDPQPAPSLSVTTLDGASVSLTDLRGQVVLVYFWATW